MIADTSHSEKDRKGWNMAEIVFPLGVVGVVALWFVMGRWVLPAMGVPT